MSGPNSTPPRPTDPVPPDDYDEPPLEGVLTAEEIEEALRNGITFADLIREVEESGRSDA